MGAAKVEVGFASSNITVRIICRTWSKDEYYDRMEQTYDATMSGLEGILDSFHTFIARLQSILINVEIFFRQEISLEKGGFPQTWVSNKQDYFLFPRGRCYR